MDDNGSFLFDNVSGDDTNPVTDFFDGVGIDGTTPITKSKPKIKMPSPETIAKFAGGAGVVALKGSKIALKVARIATNLASKGVNAISKSDILKKTVPSLLTLGANVAILPLALTVGLVNMVFLRKKPEILTNVINWNQGIKQLSTPVINDIIAPLLEVTSGAIDKVTEKGLLERLSDATGGQIPPDQISALLGGGVASLGGGIASMVGKAAGKIGKKGNSGPSPEELLGISDDYIEQ